MIGSNMHDYTIKYFIDLSSYVLGCFLMINLSQFIKICNQFFTDSTGGKREVILNITYFYRDYISLET